METFDSVAVAKWAVDKLAAAVAAFRDGLAPFGPVAARYEVALKAGNDPAALDSLVGQVLRGELLVIPDERRVYDLAISVRAQNILVNNGFETWGDLRRATVRDLLILPMFGRRCLREVLDLMDAAGIRLRDR